MSNTTDVYLEAGEKKVFAVSIHWPGWCRFAKDEGSAIQKLFEYLPRYAGIAKKAGIDFDYPESASALNVIRRVQGNKTTDFGAPAQILVGDWQGVDQAELSRMQSIVGAAWAVFDQAAQVAEGKELRKGVRGGGRDVEMIVMHVLEAEEAYLKKLGWKWKPIKGEALEQRLARLRKEVFLGLDASAAGEIPPEGPRGGKRWPARYFVRRLVWHVADHAWEMEDRTVN